MSARYPYDPFALPERPDVHLPPAVPQRGQNPFGFLKLAKLALAFLLSVGLLAFIMFVPVLLSEIGRVDAVLLAGELLPAYSFAGRLTDLFFGTFIVATAILSFLGAVALSAGRDSDPFPQPLDRSLKNDAKRESEGGLPAAKVKHV